MEVVGRNAARVAPYFKVETNFYSRIKMLAMTLVSSDIHARAHNHIDMGV